MGEGAICIPNIGVKNRRMRRNFGLVMTAIGGIAGLLLIAARLSGWVRLLLFLPFYLGMIGVFQAREKT